MHRRTWEIAFTLLLLVASGCAQVGKPKPSVFAGRAPADASSIAGRDPRALPIFDGRTGESMDWGALLQRVADAEVILLGEQHNDGLAHAVQLAVVQDAASPPPEAGAAGAMKGAAWGGQASGTQSPKGTVGGGTTATVQPRWGALTLEMLERDEQHVLDDYLEGLIDAKTLATLTLSESWAGEGSWAKWYQPIIDAAASGGWRVIAANAPRRYVTIARTEGYDVLMRLPASRRKTFALPYTNPPAYYERFKAVMAHGHGVSTRPSTMPATQPASRPASELPPVNNQMHEQPPATQPATRGATSEPASTAPPPSGMKPSRDKPATKRTSSAEHKAPPVPKSRTAKTKKPPTQTKSTPPPAPKSTPKPPPTRTAPQQPATALPAAKHTAPPVPSATRPSAPRATVATAPAATRPKATVTAGSSLVPGQNMDPGFRSQMLWDATMADSIARARRAGASKVIHLVGQFHSDFAGGTVQELLARRPGEKILTISMQREDGSSLLSDDRGRADIVIYTGEPEPEPEEEDDAPLANVPIGGK